MEAAGFSDTLVATCKTERCNETGRLTQILTSMETKLHVKAQSV
jgi:hypothetical protein